MFAIVAGLLAIAACRRASPRVEKYEATSDPGIEVTAFLDRNWAGRSPRSVLSYQIGRYDEGWSGFHVDADGTIWVFDYLVTSRDSERCRADLLRAGSYELEACLYADSTLAGRLAAREREQFLRHAGSIADDGLLDGGRTSTAPERVFLRLDGFGTKQGEPITVAECGGRRAQLTSDDARYFIQLFQRISRVLPRLEKMRPGCGSLRHGNEIVPGVRGWWVR